MFRTILFGGLVGAGLMLSCSSDSESDGQPTASGGAGGQAGGGGVPAITFGTSDCGTCVNAACSGEWTACLQDPGCATHLECLTACGVADNGDIDSVCAESCAVPDSSTAQGAIDSLTYCWQLGDAVTGCPACGNQAFSDPDLAQVCPPSDETNICWKCQDEKCCDTDQQCRDNQQCVDLFLCLQSCPLSDEDCWPNCFEMYPDGQLDVGAKMGCLNHHCLFDCGALPNTCIECNINNCGEERLACTKNPSCYLANDCISFCGDEPGCIEGCVEKYPDAEPELTNSLLCTFANCEVECSGI